MIPKLPKGRMDVESKILEDQGVHVQLYPQVLLADYHL